MCMAQFPDDVSAKTIWKALHLDRIESGDFKNMIGMQALLTLYSHHTFYHP